MDRHRRGVRFRGWVPNTHLVAGEEDHRVVVLEVEVITKVRDELSADRGLVRDDTLDLCGQMAGEMGWTEVGRWGMRGDRGASCCQLIVAHEDM